MTESATFRTFIGIPVPSDVQRELDFWLTVQRRTHSKSSPRERRIPAANRHMTLHFLGNLSQGERARLRENLSQTLAGATSFELRLDTLEHFPDARSPIVAAVCQTTPTLNQLWNSCAEALKRSRLQHLISARTFKPHITLIRCSHRQQRDHAGSGNAEGLPEIVFPVEQVSLFDSQVDHRGSSYRPIHSITLNQ